MTLLRRDGIWAFIKKLYNFSKQTKEKENCCRKIPTTSPNTENAKKKKKTYPSFCSSKELLVMKKFFQHKERHQIAEHGLGTLVRKLLHGTTESGCTVENSQKLGELTCRHIHHPYTLVSRTWCGSSHSQHRFFKLLFFWHQCKPEFGLQLDLTWIEFPRFGFMLSMFWGKGVTCEIFRSEQTLSIKRTARLKSWLGELEQPCWDSAFGLSKTPRMSYINLHCLVSGFRH